MHDQHLARKEAAAYLGVTTGTLRVWASTGKYDIPYYYVKRNTYYLKSDLDKFIVTRKKLKKRSFVNWEAMFKRQAKELYELKRLLKRVYNSNDGCDSLEWMNEFERLLR